MRGEFLTGFEKPPKFWLAAKGSDQISNAVQSPWYLKFAGVTLQCNYYVFHLIDRVLSNFPEIKAIVEIGTGYGGFSIYNGLLGCRHNIDVYTWDIEDFISEETGSLLNKLNVQRNLGDVFAQETIAEIASICSSGPVYLICDGGNKREEYRTYSPLLSSGSVISVHDFGIEFDEEDATDYSLTAFEPTEWFRFNAQFATWIKQDN